MATFDPSSAAYMYPPHYAPPHAVPPPPPAAQQQQQQQLSHTYGSSPSQSPPSSAEGSPHMGGAYPHVVAASAPIAWDNQQQPPAPSTLDGAFGASAAPSSAIAPAPASFYGVTLSPIAPPPSYPPLAYAQQQQQQEEANARAAVDSRRTDLYPPPLPPPPTGAGIVLPALTGPYGALSRPLTHREETLLAHLDRLKFFLATAPSRWGPDAPANAADSPVPEHADASGNGNGNGTVTVPAGHPHASDPALNRFALPNNEFVSCVLWNGLYHITGTDIVRALVFRFEAFGRPVRNMKKFEEGVFSDLRNLKPGQDACLEEPKVRAACACERCAVTDLFLVVSVLGSPVQVPVHPHSEEAKSVLLVRA
jgi:transcription factor STE12